MLIRIVVGIDTSSLRKRMRTLLIELPDVVVQTVAIRKKNLWNQLGRDSGDLVLITQTLLPEPIAENLAALRSVPESPEVVVLCSDDDAEEQARLIASGCYATLDSRLSDRLLQKALQTLVERKRQESSASLNIQQKLLEEPRLSDFVSESPSMQAFMDVAQRVVNTDTTLLLTGETGVGKERLARAIHAESPRSEGPFIAVNCGAIPEALLESELFGHEEGAFTGATRSRRGWFELAHKGTIFLDEIGDMPLHLQVKLLRVLQTYEIQRVGSESTMTVDVRVMAATNRDLENEAKDGRFRLDLYYRLSVVTLQIPPLRERQEDILGLVGGYINHLQGKFSTSVRSISQPALAALRLYSWPGNVRELVNVLERAMILCRGEEICLEDFPASVRGELNGRHSREDRSVPGNDTPTEWLKKPLKEIRRQCVADIERRYLDALLRDTGGRIGETADRAGIDPRSLFEKMRTYGLRKETYRQGQK